jgi:hypothetical protein
MRTGVAAIHLGVLTIGDVRAALGRRFGTTRTVEVLVPSATGLPFAGVLALITKPSGRAEHAALACPLCGQARFRLYVRRGRLGCASCVRVHPRRNVERTMASWTRGGREEDRLLRLVAGRGRPTTAALGRAGRLARDLVLGDEDRAGAAIQVARAALLAMQAEQ